ncbi:MAG TPA: hypothetical protein VN256_07065 [Pyrinomonadaceae bacterium]|nr:hypothetical protein [Pyrinomonadaceae bacterium]
MSKHGEPTPVDSPSGRRRAADFARARLPLLLSAGVLLLYLPLLTKNYYWDGIFFSRVIEEARGLDVTLLHPNHLIYNVVGYLFYKLAQGAGLQVRAVEVLQILNCIFGAASAYVLFRILQDCFRSVYLSTTLTLLFAVSATWWKFATDADSYIPSVFFLLVSFYFVLPHREPRPFLAAAAHAASMLFHQLAIFFFPVAVLGILLQTTSQPTKRRIINVIKYAAAAFILTFPAFLYSFYLITGGLEVAPLVRWLTTFSPEHGFTFSFSDNLTYTLRGHSRLIAGGRLSFLRDLGGPFMYAMTALLLLVAAAFFYKLFRHFKELRTGFRAAPEDRARLRALRLLCGAWIVCYVVFLFFFIPQNTFYRLFYLPALVVLAGSFIAPYEAAPNHAHRYRAALFVAMLAIANLTFTAYPYALVRATPPLALALELNKSWPKGAVVYFAQWNSDNELIRYFNPQTVWREVNRETFEKEIKEAGGASAWMDTTLIELYLPTPEGRNWLDAHAVRRPEHELVNDKYKLRFYEIKRDTPSP